MTVEELRNALKDMPADLIVIVREGGWIDSVEVARLSRSERLEPEAGLSPAGTEYVRIGYRS